MKITDNAIRELGRRRWRAEKCVPLRGLLWLVGMVAGAMVLVPVILWLAGGR